MNPYRMERYPKTRSGIILRKKGHVRGTVKILSKSMKHLCLEEYLCISLKGRGQPSEVRVGVVG